MIKLISPYFNYTDERGSITGIINSGEWRELNIIRSDSGIIRGNHYHQKTRELFVILDGEIEIHIQNVEYNKLSGETEIFSVKAGDVFIVEPMINHTFIPKKPSRWINALSISMGSNDQDIHRV